MGPSFTVTLEQAHDTTDKEGKRARSEPEYEVAFEGLATLERDGVRLLRCHPPREIEPRAA